MSFVSFRPNKSWRRIGVKVCRPPQSRLMMVELKSAAVMMPACHGLSVARLTANSTAVLSSGKAACAASDRSGCSRAE